jgi:signal transduction histidine kinase
MTHARGRGIAIGLFALTVAMSLVAVGLGLTTPGSSVALFALIAVPLIASVYAGAGSLLVARLPGNRIGWVVLGIGFFQGLNILNSAYGDFAFARSGSPLAFGGISGWAGTWTWYPSIGLLVTFLPLLFPDGRPPSPRWRPVAWLAGVGIAIGLIGQIVASWSLRHGGFGDPNYAPGGVGGGINALGTLMAGIAALLSIVSLVVRYRRSTGDEREQLRWFVFAATFVLVALIFASTSIDRQYVLLSIGFFLLPIAVALAVLKYRLYDIDVVIKKTLVALVLTVVIGGPVLLVVAVASQVLLWQGTGKLLTLGGGIVLGIALVPLIRISRRIADRIVYGRRASSYEVLAEFSERMAETYATDDVLPRMATILLGAAGATSATVWLRIGEALRPAATAGAGTNNDDIPVAGEELPAIPGFAVEVRHQGELLGALSAQIPANDPLDAGRERLIRDLASQAGLVLRNVRLIEELRASRQRLVVAQDEERRRLERNIHDGAQQQLVALSVQLGLLERQIDADPNTAKAAAAQLKADATTALEDLRVLARGIYPPLLADRGLPAALEAQARRSTVPVSVESDGVGRYGQDVEAAVYFCVLEALQNVAKYAKASRATVGLTASDGVIGFEVSDDGVGFDPAVARGSGVTNMRDRLESLGGSLRLETRPGGGTKVIGRIPLDGPSLIARQRRRRAGSRTDRRRDARLPQRLRRVRASTPRDHGQRRVQRHPHPAHVPRGVDLPVGGTEGSKVRIQTILPHPGAAQGLRSRLCFTFGRSDGSRGGSRGQGPQRCGRA